MNHSLPWRPRFVFGTGGDTTNWALRLPMLPWDRQTPTVGGSRTAASGVPAAYVVRRDYNLQITLRVYETELDTLDAMIRWGQGSEAFLFYPDRADDSESYLVYLESPLAGDDWTPQRVRGYGKVFEMNLLLRLVSGGPWTLDYFSCVDA